jgi:hypothetical protein
MNKRRWKNKRKNISQTNANTPGKTSFPGETSLNLSKEVRSKGDYFLGFRRFNYNGLWRWDTLEDVKF